MSDGWVAFRFGYGLPLPEGAAVQVPAMMAALRGPDLAAQAHPAGGMAALLPLMAAMRDTKIALKQAPQDKSANKAERRAVRAGKAMATAGLRAALARALDAPDGLRERLVAFWADHFTTVARGRGYFALPGTLIEDAIRPNLTAPFAQMLLAVTLHPAMLLYLDQAQSMGPTSKRGSSRSKGLNENLARELLELHTLGVGADYGQADVREMAELLTGLTFVQEKGFAFDSARAEPGPETVLGVTYHGAGVAPVEAALRDLSVRPETARHLGFKLAVHFGADEPDAGLVAALEAVWLGTGGDLGAVVQALLEHPAARGPAQKARQPFEFIVASLRALGISGTQLVGMKEDVFDRMIAAPLKDMGQPYLAAPGPDGWPEAMDAWINPQRLAARITWAMEVPGRLVVPLPDPRDFAARALGDRADERLIWAAARAESLREGVGLVLASPGFNRR